MNVAEFPEKQGRAVTTGGAGRTSWNADRLAASDRGDRIGAHRYVAGIVSERDIILALRRAGPSSLKRPYRRHDQACRHLPETALDEAMAMRTGAAVRHLPVVTDGAWSGSSHGDGVKHHSAEVEMEATAMRDYIAHS